MIPRKMVARLVSLAHDFRLDPTDLDEFVYECAGHARADAYNSEECDASCRLSADSEWDDWADVFDEDASSANNGGLEAQIRYLVDKMGASVVEKELRRLAAEA